MPKSYGWAGQVLWVDLTGGEVRKIPTGTYEPEKFLGGMGLNTKIFWDLGCPKVDAFHPENPFIISVGPLTCAVGPFQRAMIGSIAPQAYPEELFSYSSVGGRFPGQLKYAGYDALVVTGKAENPVYISIEDENIDIKNAEHLWGADALSTGEYLVSKDPSAAALCIGISGENLSRIAAIVNQTGSTAGEGGFGAVMGAKNLKAVRVKGSGTVNIARPDEWLRVIDEGKSAGDYDGIPTTFFRKPLFGKEARKAMVEKYRTRFAGCVGCPYQCHSRYNVPGIGTAAQFCAPLGNYAIYAPDDAGFLWKQVMLLQTLCIDSISVTSITGFLYECHKKGILKEKDFASIGISTPQWLGGTSTNQEFVSSLLYPIAKGTSVFSDGLPRAMENFGKEAFEIYRSYFVARGYPIHWHTTVSQSLHWALDSRDPASSCHDHLDFHMSPEIAGHFCVAGGRKLSNSAKNISYQGVETTAAYCVKHQMIKNSLPWCEWQSQPRNYFRPPEMDITIMESRSLSAVTGIDIDPDALLRTGERIWNLQRAVMVLRENRTRKDDILDDYHFEKKGKVVGPMPLEMDMGAYDALKENGPLDRNAFEKLKDDYYRLAGWETKTGRPKRQTLEKLRLSGVADVLENKGCLPA
ncbi:MAG: aldehyde ferredoxin oxidoreductase N-terminal domain-containing protein [Desulfobacterales bacterium]